MRGKTGRKTRKEKGDERIRKGRKETENLRETCPAWPFLIKSAIEN